MTMKMNSKELKKAAQFAATVAEQTGKRLLSYQKKLHLLTVSSKEAQGVFSEADVEAEIYIYKKLKSAYPDIPILGEEAAFEEFKGEKHSYINYSKKEWAWIVDPLDGTNNFLNGMDYFAVCISLCHFGKPVVGIVHRPNPFQTFLSYEGGGCWTIARNKKLQKIYQEKLSKKLKESMLVTGFITEKGKPLPAEFECFKRMMGNSRGIRRMGSAALDLCYVAQGIFDGFWERGLAPWDMAAASIICMEAGVKVTDYKGRKFSAFGETILAARRPIYNQMKSIINAEIK